MADKLVGSRSHWKIVPVAPGDLFDKTDISPMLTHLLYVRGYKQPESILQFIDDPIFEHDPLLIPDMKKAVARIRKAIKNKEKVAVYADFDSDGLTSGAIMATFLKDHNLDPEVVIPQRKEGHGMASFRLKELKDKKVSLIITVDNGVTSVEEVKEAQNMGMDVIITDHHEPRDTGELPPCLVVNPNRLDSKYPFSGLSGAGVAYKVVHAVEKKSPEHLLDLTALGTIADVVPIRDENRGFVMRGLRQMQKQERVGLVSLLSACEVDANRLNSGTVAFHLAPRINAANRIADPCTAYNLLMADNYVDAERYAAELGDLNKLRQKLLDEALTPILEDLGYPPYLLDAVEEGIIPPILIVKGKWIPGISGLIASRLTDIFGLPAIVASEDDGFGRISASARSVPGVNIIGIIESAHKRGAKFHKYGGHSGAAGFIIKQENWEKAEQCLKDASVGNVPKSVGSTLNIDAEIPFCRVNMNSINQIEKLAPFGQSFPEPLFMSTGVYITDQKKIGDGKHLSFKITDKTNNCSVRGVMFSHDPELEDIEEDQPIDIVFHMEANAFKGYPSAEIRVKDWRLADI